MARDKKNEKADAVNLLQLSHTSKMILLEIGSGTGSDSDDACTGFQLLLNVQLETMAIARQNNFYLW